MGRKRRKSPQQKAEDELREVIEAMTIYGVPPDAQEKIIITSWRYIKQSCGLTPMFKLIYGEDWEPPVQQQE